jgi:hypothetical protein
MSDEKLNEAIVELENYFLGEGGECGEKLFVDFAKTNKQKFLSAKINQSTENNFEFTELYQDFQIIYENKLESIILKSGLTIDEFYDLLKIVK